MKKILFLLCLIFVFQSSSFASETIVSGSELKMSDVQTFWSEGKKPLLGLKDKSGNIVVKAQYKKIIRLGQGAWIVQKNSRFGIMDSSGSYIVPVKYRHADRIMGKFAKLGNSNDFGLYDENGKNIIAPEYSSIDPLFGEKFLVCKDFKYGVTDIEGKTLLNNEFDDIYMPKPTVMRLKYQGDWYEIERMTKDDIELPEGVKKVTINDKDFKVTKLVQNTGLISGYSVVTATDYGIKVFSSLSPAYEQTIDELMLSQGAETVNIFMKLGWIPMFPITYAQKYFQNIRNPHTGPLSEIRKDLKKQIW